MPEPSEQEYREIDKPWNRDAAEITERLTAWAAKTIDPHATVQVVEQPGGSGFSSETMLFDLRRTPEAGVERCVARLAPLPSLIPVFPTYDLELQKRCMETVAQHSDVPVPSTPFYEADPAWVGTPFLVMGRVDGVVPTDVPPYLFGGWVCDGTPEQRRSMQRAAASVLARLHAITPASADLTFLDRPEHGRDALDQHLNYQRWYYEWARGDDRFPIIDRTFAWLDAHRPAHPSPTVFNWGDSRIGNMMWRDYEPVAVLDWEMAALGPGEVDVAWMAFLHRFFQDIAERVGMPGLPDFLRREDLAADYEALSGRAVRDLEWYEVFGALRFAIVSVRTTARGIAYGQAERPADNDDYIMFRHLLEQMLDGSYWR
jgi:aminoglycoside phosphotransferase (APT) family kinase protein